MQRLLPSQQIGLLQCGLLGHGTRLEVNETAPGLQNVSVFNYGRLVATFTCPSGAVVTSGLLEDSAANDATMPSTASGADSWYDKEMLDEPIEPLPEFV